MVGRCRLSVEARRGPENSLVVRDLPNSAPAAVRDAVRRRFGLLAAVCQRGGRANERNLGAGGKSAVQDRLRNRSTPVLGG